MILVTPLAAPVAQHLRDARDFASRGGFSGTVLLLVLPEVFHIDIAAVIWKLSWGWVIQGGFNTHVRWFAGGSGQQALAPRHVAPGSWAPGGWVPMRKRFLVSACIFPCIPQSTGSHVAKPTVHAEGTVRECGCKAI